MLPFLIGNETNQGWNSTVGTSTCPGYLLHRAHMIQSFWVPRNPSRPPSPPPSFGTVIAFSVTRAMSFPLCSQSLVGFTPSDDGVWEDVRGCRQAWREASHPQLYVGKFFQLRKLDYSSYYLLLLINTTSSEKHKPPWSVRLWLICRLSKEKNFQSQKDSCPCI